MTARPWISGRDYTGCGRISKAVLESRPEMPGKGDAHLISRPISD
jgi:hypothetical protein